MMQLKTKWTNWFLAIFLLTTTLPLQAQKTITGKYIAWTADSSNIIVLRIQQKDTGFTVQYDLPLARVMDATAKNVVRKGDTFRISLPRPSATITALISYNKLPSAAWQQNKDSVKLNIKPLLRPQTPKPPFSYLSDSVEYDNADKSVHLAATLTYPKGTKKFPAAILITGSGLEDRDETIFDHKSFAVIADYLTRQGIAVLRVDDRMRGKSKGDVTKATSADFASDVLTSLAWLKSQPNIDSTKIGLIGHSEGGMLAAMAYAQWPYFSYIVSLGGTGVPGSTILQRQQTDPLKKMVGPAAYAAYYQLVQQKFVAFDKYYDSDSMAAASLATSFETWKNQQSDSVLTELNVKAVNSAMYAFQMRLELGNPWLKYFMHANPADYWQKVKCPVLVLNGEKDTQVDAAQNTTAIKNTLQKANNSKVAVQILPNHNHLFQHCTTGEFAEYALIEETFSPDALSSMAKWFKSIQIIK